MAPSQASLAYPSPTLQPPPSMQFILCPHWPSGQFSGPCLTLVGWNFLLGSWPAGPLLLLWVLTSNMVRVCTSRSSRHKASLSEGALGLKPRSVRCPCTSHLAFLGLSFLICERHTETPVQGATAWWE
jgi:hypothetical protein